VAARFADADQAAATMDKALDSRGNLRAFPDFAPGVGGDVVVTAFQSACGLVNLVTPTAAVVMGALALGRIPYEKWLKFVWKLMLLFLLLTGLLLVLAAALS